MIKKILLIFIILIKVIPSSSMEYQSLLDMDPKVAFDKINQMHEKTQSQLRKFKLNNPELATKTLQQIIKKDKDPLNYLQTLHLLASALLYQHIILKTYADMFYFIDNNLRLKDELIRLKRKFTKQRNATLDSKTLLVPDNDTQANEILAHHDTFNTSNPLLTNEQFKVALSWLVDKNKGEWINAIGEYLILQNDLQASNEKKNAITADLKNLINNVSEPLFTAIVTNQFVFATISYLFEIIKVVDDGNDRQSQNPVQSALSPLELKQTKLIQEILKLYLAHQTTYIQLYDIVLKELRQTFKELMSAGRKNLAQYLVPFDEMTRKIKSLPTKFPDQLAIIDAAKELVLPSSQELINKAKTEWEQSQAQTPSKKKYIKRVKKITSLATKTTPQEGTTKSGEEVTKMRTASDNSYIAEGAENDIQIIIEDPKNDATITLFKTKMTPANAARLKNLPRKDYTSNVQQWFDNPEKARIEQGYTDPKSPKYRAGEPIWKPIVLHSFSRLVDDYIYQYGTVGEVNSRTEKDKKDILVTVPGKLEYLDGTEETGVFAYIIDSKTGQWYHRMFTPHASKNLISDLFEKGYFAPEMTGYYDVFFPALPSRKK